MDLFSDSNLEKSRQKQNSFLSLLPPPPRTMSKILPPSLSTNCQAFYQTDPKTAPTQIMKNSQAELQEASAIVETDKDGLLNGISKFIKKPIEMSNNRKLNNLLPDQIADDARNTHIRTSLIGLTSPSKIAIPARVQSTKNSSSSSNEFSDPSMRSTTTKLSNTETLSPNK